MKWKIVSAKEFSDYKKEWDVVNTKSSDSILLSSTYISESLKYFSSGKELLCICYDKDAPVAACIVHKTRFGIWETFQPSQNPIGAWNHTDSIGLVQLGISLLKDLPGLGLILGITQQDPELFKRPIDSWHIKTLDYIETARITIRETFDVYWSRRGKNLRQNTNKHYNRLLKEDIKPEIRCISKTNDMSTAITQYAELESLGWKFNSGTAVSINNNQGKFYLDLLKSFSEHNHARIYQYWYGDNLASTDLCIDDNNTLIILKTTYDEKIRKTSPANIMRKTYMEELFNTGTFNHIEFYGRVMKWHKQWTDETRTMFHINIYSCSILGWIYSLISNLKK